MTGVRFRSRRSRLRMAHQQQMMAAVQAAVATLVRDERRNQFRRDVALIASASAPSLLAWSVVAILLARSPSSVRG